MTDPIIAESRAVLAHHARSFDWAGWFLPASARDDAAVIYAFCRLVDDLADEAESPIEADENLYQLRRELLGQAEARPLIRGTLEVFTRCNIDLAPALELMDGVCSDLGTVRVADDRELLRYCYRVASTVGLMMCGVLGVTAPHALPHAVDLGVAMQLTNICRDVLEDAENDRVYLPQTRLRAAGIDHAQLLAGATAPSDELRSATSTVVCDLLELAERYYQSGDHGMRYIPAKSRVAIVVAARVYRSIGVKLAANQGDALAGRTSVGALGKLRHTTAALAATLVLALTSGDRHDPDLHHLLAGLPGVQA